MLDAWTAAVKRAKGDPVLLIRALLIPLAYLFGRWSYHRELYKENELMKKAYDEIDANPPEDKDVDEALDKGEF